jgi:tRNA dimethylallyltransferase
VVAPLDPPIVVLTGPTAVGKSALALQVANDLAAEVLSADSRQVYRYLDIGTAKPSPAEQRAVRHHLLDLVDPDEPFSVADYQAAAEAAILDTARRGKVPLLVGGSPHYVQAVVDRLHLPLVPPDPAIRAQLDALAHAEGALGLYARLASLDPEAAQRVDRSNPRRLVRALELVMATGKPAASLARGSGPPRRALLLALTRPRAELYARIDARVDAMLAQGWIEEVEGLLNRGYDPQLPSLSATGYREVVEYLKGLSSLGEARRRICYRAHAFARRQYTWLRRDPRVEWLEASEVQPGELLRRIRAFLADAKATARPPGG